MLVTTTLKKTLRPSDSSNNRCESNYSPLHYTLSLNSDASSFSKVLRNDVMSHVRTMESLNQAGRGLLEVGSGESPHGLQSRLEQLNESWEFVRCETERRQLELENRLSQVNNTPTFFILLHLQQI